MKTRTLSRGAGRAAGRPQGVSLHVATPAQHVGTPLVGVRLRVRRHSTRLLRLVPACIVLCLVMLPGVAEASSGPAQTQTLQVGPYVVNVNLAQYPPQTDQADAVTVVPQNSSVHLSGHILMEPGLGTDAVELRSSLSPVGSSSTLAGSIRMPVRGAWNIVVQLDGPQGQGEATFPIVVAAPGAMPIWLGWVIGLTPLLGVAWLVWHQLRYRRKLMVKTQQ